MKKSNILFFLSICLAVIVSPAISQDFVTYNHPELEISFLAPSGWQGVDHPEDDLIYEITDPEGDIHVHLWYTESGTNSESYITGLANRKGLTSSGSVSPLKGKEREAIWMTATGEMNGEDSQVFLVAIPDQTGTFIVQIWCPAEQYPGKKRLMENILYSLEAKD